MKNKDKYSIKGLPEAEFEPGSRQRVLKNLLGIKSKRQIDEKEAEALLETEEKCIKQYSVEHRFSVQDICYMHRLFLGHIYPWAGKYRNVNLAKNNFTFASARYISQLMERFTKEILHKYTPCNFRERKKVIEAIAIVHGELLLIHPFREGNGRLARLLADLMAFQAGLPPLDFGFIKGKNKKIYYEAIRKCMARNYTAIKTIVRRAVQRALRRFKER